MSTVNVGHLECFLAVAEELHFGRARASGPTELVIAHTPELGQLLLPLMLAHRPAVLPEPRGWRPVQRHTPEQLSAVQDGGVDIGICWSVSVHPPLSRTVLGTVGMVAVLRGDDPLADHAVIPLDTLRSRSLLRTPRSDNPFVTSQLHAEFVRAGAARLLRAADCGNMGSQQQVHDGAGVGPVVCGGESSRSGPCCPSTGVRSLHPLATSRSTARPLPPSGVTRGGPPRSGMPIATATPSMGPVRCGCS